MAASCFARSPAIGTRSVTPEMKATTQHIIRLPARALPTRTGFTQSPQRTVRTTSPGSPTGDFRRYLVDSKVLLPQSIFANAFPIYFIFPAPFPVVGPEDHSDPSSTRRQTRDGHFPDPWRPGILSPILRPWLQKKRCPLSPRVFSCHV